MRVYSEPVGWKNPPDVFKKEPECMCAPVWDPVQHDKVFVTVPLKPGYELWFNPFTEEVERAPAELDSVQQERNKERSAASSMHRTVSAIYEYARANVWDWFLTLTFDPGKVDSFDYDIVVKKLSKWLNNSRSACPDMRYLVVPELHESGRFHFHGLFGACDGLGFAHSGRLDHGGNPVYNVGAYKFGWSTATKIVSQERVTKYIAKYINKDLCAVAFGKKRYWASRNLNKADVQEVFLEADKKEMLLQKLAAVAAHVKKAEAADIQTFYFELENEVLDDYV